VLLPALFALLTLPLPKLGVLVPVSITVAADAEDSAELAKKAEVLRQAACRVSRHIRLVKDPAAAAVVFELQAYDNELPPASTSRSGGLMHHFEGRYYIHGKWEPFRSWSSYSSERPDHPNQGEFVEELVFDPDTITRERIEARQVARGREVPRSEADVTACLPK
jgi:hypothetical protein